MLFAARNVTSGASGGYRSLYLGPPHKLCYNSTNGYEGVKEKNFDDRPATVNVKPI